MTPSENHSIEQAVKFLSAYFNSVPAGQLVELTCIHPDKAGGHEIRVHWWKPKTRQSLADILALLDTYNQREGYGIYFGTCPRTKIAPLGRRGSVADVDTVIAFYAELDSLKDGRTIEDDLARLEGSDIPPSVMVKSGGGLHAYWLLDTPHAMAEDEKKLAKGVLRELARRFNGDMQAAELARVLRLPGFTNTKPGRDNAMVEMMPPKEKHRYTWQEMIALIPAEAPRPRKNYEPHSSTEEEIALALSVLRPSRCDNRQEWLDVGMAVQAELGESGFSLWDSWSTQSSKYDSQDTQRVWNSFDGSGVTIGTLFHYANEDRPGWRPKKERTRADSPLEPIPDTLDLTDAQERAILSYGRAAGPSVAKVIKAVKRTYKEGETFTPKQLAKAAELNYRTLCRVLFVYGILALLGVKDSFRSNEELDSTLDKERMSKTDTTESGAPIKPSYLLVCPSSERISQYLMDEIIIPAELKKCQLGSDRERDRSRVRVDRWRRELSDPVVSPEPTQGPSWKSDYRAFVAAKNATKHYGEQQSMAQAFKATGLRRETLRRAEGRLGLIHREMFNSEYRKVEHVNDLPQAGTYEDKYAGVAARVFDDDGALIGNGNLYSSQVRGRACSLLGTGSPVFVMYQQSPLLTSMDEDELREWESEQLRAQEKREAARIERERLGIKKKDKVLSEPIIGWDAEAEKRIVKMELRFHLAVSAVMNLAERALRVLRYRGPVHEEGDKLVESLLRSGARLISVEYDEEAA